MTGVIFLGVIALVFLALIPLNIADRRARARMTPEEGKEDDEDERRWMQFW
jgi:hypothetical protein